MSERRPMTGGNTQSDSAGGGASGTAGGNVVIDSRRSKVGSIRCGGSVTLISARHQRRIEYTAGRPSTFRQLPHQLLVRCSRNVDGFVRQRRAVRRQPEPYRRRWRRSAPWRRFSRTNAQALTVTGPVTRRDAASLRGPPPSAHLTTERTVKRKRRTAAVVSAGAAHAERRGITRRHARRGLSGVRRNWARKDTSRELLSPRSPLQRRRRLQPDRRRGAERKRPVTYGGDGQAF